VSPRIAPTKAIQVYVSVLPLGSGTLPSEQLRAKSISKRSCQSPHWELHYASELW
jgi:hypothetical protein